MLDDTGRSLTQPTQGILTGVRAIHLVEKWSSGVHSKEISRPQPINRQKSELRSADARTTVILKLACQFAESVEMKCGSSARHELRFKAFVNLASASFKLERMGHVLKIASNLCFFVFALSAPFYVPR